MSLFQLFDKKLNIFVTPDSHRREFDLWYLDEDGDPIFLVSEDGGKEGIHEHMVQIEEGRFEVRSKFFPASPPPAPSLAAQNRERNTQPAEVNAPVNDGLMPCPFCGGEPEMFEPTEPGNEGGMVIGCKNCQACTRVHFGEYEKPLISAWNTRARPTSQWIPEPVKPVVHDGCMADRDGDCSWEGCPQLRDGEPANSGRHCPRDKRDEDE